MGRIAIDPDNAELWINQVVGIQQSRIYALYLSCMGLTNKEIAKAFDRSVRTITKWQAITCLELGARTKFEGFYQAGKLELFAEFDPFDKDKLMRAGVGKYRQAPVVGRPRKYKSKLR